jgi:hypothetical protein
MRLPGAAVDRRLRDLGNSSGDPWMINGEVSVGSSLGFLVSGSRGAEADAHD